ncbi:Unknown protein, partial [Striga hermonthica]
SSYDTVHRVVSIGNISSIHDLATRTILPDRAKAVVPDRRVARLWPSDAVLSLFWKDPLQPHHPDSAFDHRERHSNWGSESSWSKSNR